MNDLRREYAEHLVTQAASGFKDVQWDRDAHAFIFWCYRQDEEERMVDDRACSDCSHPYHVGGVCGTPERGSFPHLTVCLCGNKGTKLPTSHIVMEMSAVNFILKWIDDATEMLQSFRPKDKKRKDKIKALLKIPTSGMALFTLGRNRR